MIRAYSSLLFWLSAIIVSSVLLYRTSDRVNVLDTSLRQLQVQVEKEQERIHVLKAEWVYLSNPARIKSEAMRHLKLRPTELEQVTASLVSHALSPVRDDSAYSIASDEYSGAQKTASVNKRDRQVAKLNAGRINDRIKIQNASVRSDEGSIIAATDNISSLIGSLSLRP